MDELLWIWKSVLIVYLTILVPLDAYSYRFLQYFGTILLFTRLVENGKIALNKVLKGKGKKRQGPPFFFIQIMSRNVNIT